MGERLDAAPARHLEMLLARAQNPFDISDDVLERLGNAVLSRFETYEGRPCAGMPPTARCGNSRHTFLLSDGGVSTIWELWHHVPGPGGGSGLPRFEIYECEEALRASDRRAHGGGVPAQQASGAEDREVPGPVCADPARLRLEEATRSRPWSCEDSPDHARRLLRRAENPDRPGDDTARLLAGARGHDIVHVPRPRVCPPGGRLWCSLYEHAFLLEDGSEIRLYELEHDVTGGEGLVCEVYLDEAVADRAARRHARTRGVEL